MDKERNACWFLIGAYALLGAFNILVLLIQSRIYTRRCADVFDQYCRTAAFRAPLWQTMVFFVSKLGCVAWWATERIMAPEWKVARADAEGRGSRPLLAYFLLFIPSCLTLMAFALTAAALYTLSASSVVVCFALGYVVCMLFHSFVADTALSQALIMALICSAVLLQICSNLIYHEHFQMDIVVAQVFAFLAPCVFALKVLITYGLCARFNFHAALLDGMEGVFGIPLAFAALTIADAIKLEDTSATVFQLLTSTLLTYTTVALVISYCLQNTIFVWFLERRDLKILTLGIFLLQLPWIILGEMALGLYRWYALRVTAHILVLAAIFLYIRYTRFTNLVIPSRVSTRRGGYIEHILTEKTHKDSCPLCVAEQFISQAASSHSPNTLAF